MCTYLSLSVLAELIFLLQFEVVLTLWTPPSYFLSSLQILKTVKTKSEQQHSWQKKAKQTYHQPMKQTLKYSRIQDFNHLFSWSHSNVFRKALSSSSHSVDHRSLPPAALRSPPLTSSVWNLSAVESCFLLPVEMVWVLQQIPWDQSV